MLLKPRFSRYDFAEKTLGGEAISLGQRTRVVKRKTLKVDLDYPFKHVPYPMNSVDEKKKDTQTYCTTFLFSSTVFIGHGTALEDKRITISSDHVRIFEVTRGEGKLIYDYNYLSILSILRKYYSQC